MLVQKKINIRIMCRYKSVVDGKIFECIDIITHEVVNGRKKALSEAIFCFRYINRPGEFKTRLQDVRRALIFNQWIEIS